MGSTDHHNSHICLTSMHNKSHEGGLNEPSDMDISYRLVRAHSQAQMDEKDAIVQKMRF
jgi:hypothetical protein